MWGTKLTVAPTRDRSQCQHCVDEGGHEDPEGQLRTDISNERPQHTRTELLRCQGEGQDGYGEDDTDHRDDSSGNAYENRTSLVCVTRSDPPRKMQSAPVDCFIEVVGDGEENYRGRNAQGRYEPKGRA